MINIEGFSIHALTRGIRWIRIYTDYPNDLKLWTDEQNRALQCICEAFDKRGERK